MCKWAQFSLGSSLSAFYYYLTTVNSQDRAAIHPLFTKFSVHGQLLVMENNSLIGIGIAECIVSNLPYSHVFYRTKHLNLFRFGLRTFYHQNAPGSFPIILILPIT